MKGFKIILAAIAILINTACQKNENAGKFTKTDCPLDLPLELVESDKFLYGKIEVPELSEHPNGKTIKLAVAIFKCRLDSASRDPLVLHAGGPGSSNIDEFVPLMAGGLGNLFLDQRDVVIIETRGLKYAKPILELPGINKLQYTLLNKNLTVDETHDMFLDSLQAAYKKLNNEGVNLSAYNSYEISNEIAYVMEKLGYDTFSFFGTSYGTEVAQYLLMNHPNRMTSVAMNGTMDINLGGHHMHSSLIKTMDDLFQKLESNPETAAAYPNLKTRFLTKLHELNKNPEIVMIQDKQTQKKYQVVLNGNRVALWIFHQMYNNTQIQLSFHKIINDNYSEIIADPGIILPIPDFSLGLNLSVFLSETQNIQAENLPVEGEYKDLIKGSSLALFGPYFLDKAHKVWPVDAARSIKPIKADIPILLLGGRMDYLCRPSYAQGFADNQKNAYLFIFEGVGHSPVDQGDCAIMMIKEFFENPDVAPNSSCVNAYEHQIVMPES